MKTIMLLIHYEALGVLILELVFDNVPLGVKLE